MKMAGKLLPLPAALKHGTEITRVKRIEAALSVPHHLFRAPLLSFFVAYFLLLHLFLCFKF